MKKVVSTIIAFIGVISGLITILQGARSFIEENTIIVTPVMAVCSGLVVLCIIVITIIFSRTAQYRVYKYISYVTRKPDFKYHVKEKEIFYTYKDRENLQYRKKAVLIAQSDGFSSYTGKFRWSKSQPLEDFHVYCQSEHHGLVLGRNSSWNTYTVEFDPAPKGKERTVDIVIDKLNDPTHEALPFCSCNIVEHTKRLAMTVSLQGGLKFKLDKIRFLVYNNGASISPILEEEYNPQKRHNLITYDSEHEQITIEEKWPIYGYKYQLVWEFAQP